MCVGSLALIPKAGRCLSTHHPRTGWFNAGSRTPSTLILLHSIDKQPRAELTAVPSGDALHSPQNEGWFN